MRGKKSEPPKRSMYQYDSVKLKYIYRPIVLRMNTSYINYVLYQYVRATCALPSSYFPLRAVTPAHTDCTRYHVYCPKAPPFILPSHPSTLRRPYTAAWSLTSPPTSSKTCSLPSSTTSTPTVSR